MRRNIADAEGIAVGEALQITTDMLARADRNGQILFTVPRLVAFEKSMPDERGPDDCRDALRQIEAARHFTQYQPWDFGCSRRRQIADKICLFSVDVCVLVFGAGLAYLLYSSIQRRQRTGTD